MGNMGNGFENENNPPDAPTYLTSKKKSGKSEKKSGKSEKINRKSDKNNGKSKEKIPPDDKTKVSITEDNSTEVPITEDNKTKVPITEDSDDDENCEFTDYINLNIEIPSKDKIFMSVPSTFSLNDCVEYLSTRKYSNEDNDVNESVSDVYKGDSDTDEEDSDTDEEEKDVNKNFKTDNLFVYRNGVLCSSLMMREPLDKMKSLYEKERDSDKELHEKKYGKNSKEHYDHAKHNCFKYTYFQIVLDPTAKNIKDSQKCERIVKKLTKRRHDYDIFIFSDQYK